MVFRGAKKQYQIIQTNKLSIKQIPIREGGGADDEKETEQIISIYFAIKVTEFSFICRFFAIE